ncbi:MAG: aldo/keto reductase [Pirellulales bacterium]|nr:aldo/keto reductase [Pirellulales bacterium]
MDRRQFLTSVTAAGGLAWAANRAMAEIAPPLAKRALGRSGIQVTVLGLGGFTGMKEPRSAALDPVELANAAIDAGIRYFDTAPAYGDGQSERNYGEVLAHRRNEVFLATKTGQRTYDGAMREIEASLKRLRTDYLDLIQIHNTRAQEDLALWGTAGGVLKALEQLRDQKVTRLIGVTGHESAEVMCRAIGMYDFDTVLTTFNPMPTRRAYLEKVLPLAMDKNMGILAMKVMGGAFGSLAAGNPVKNDGAPNHDDAPHQAEPGMLVRYVLGLPITAAIVGMKSLDQLKANVAAAREQPLSEQQRKGLEAYMIDASAARQ